MNLGSFTFNLTPFNVAWLFYFLSALLGFAALLVGKPAKRGRDVIWAAYAAVALGAISHTWLIADRWIAGGHPPFSGLFDAVVFFSWSTVLAFAAAEIIFRTRWLTVFLGVTEVVFFLYAADCDRHIRPLIPVLKSMWLNIHVVCYMIGYGTMTIAFFAAASYYVVLAISRDPEQVQALDRIIYRVVAFGFPLLTAGLITGAVWANRTWGRYWGWDPKETWSLISWIIFAAYLHFRFLSRSWSLPKIQRSALLNWLVMLGFGAIVFTFLMLKYLPSAKGSLHTYM